MEMRWWSGLENWNGSIEEKAGEEFNINSPKQLGVILFGKLKLPGGKEDQDGLFHRRGCIREAGARITDSYADILEYRRLAKLKSTYADGLAAVIRRG